MPDYVLQVTKKGEQEPARLLVSVGSQNNWHALASPNWFPASTGTWITGRNATKFRQWSYVILTNTSGHSVMDLPNFPLQIGSKFTVGLYDPDSFFRISTSSVDVEVVSGPPDHKTFKLREVWGAAISYTVVQAETVTFEIMDPATNDRAIYTYHGVGISIGLPKIPLPKTIPGISTPGDWNDFDAPGWWTARDFEGDAILQAPYNVGMGTSYSWNNFQFKGHVNNNPGYQCEIPSLKTGRTISLPSSGFSAGSMTLAPTTVPAPVSPR